MYKYLLKLSNHLDKISLYKLSDETLDIAVKLSQSNYPPGAESDPRAPYNQNNSGWEATIEKTDAEIAPAILSAAYDALKEQYHMKEHLKQKGHSDEEAANHIFELDPPKRLALEDMLNNISPLAGGKILNAFDNVTQTCLPTPMSFQEIFERVKHAIDTNMDDIYESEYEKMQDYDPGYDREDY